MSEYEQEYIEFRIFLIGEKGVGKKSFINRLSKLHCTKTLYPDKKLNKKSEKVQSQNSVNEKESTREETLKNRSLQNEEKSTVIDNEETPGKLYNILKYKIAFKPFYIKEADKLTFDYIPKFEDDSDYEIEKAKKISFRLVKQEISDCLIDTNLCIPIKNLGNYKITIENLFVFIFDLSNFETFEAIMLYYSTIAKKFHLDEANSGISGVLIGNKIDKKLLFDLRQQKIFSTFLNKSGMNYYEISTRPYFTFEKFFEMLFIDLYGKFRSHFQSEEFNNKLNVILSSKPTFSQAERKNVERKDNIPGPGTYNLNLYSYNSKKEIENALVNKKTKFKTKIFSTKSGPIFVREKYETSSNKDETNQKNNYFSKDMKECIDKPKPGFSFGILQGVLNLREKRRDLKKEKNEKIQKSLDEYNSRIFSSKKTLFRDDNYFKEALKRKNKYHQSEVEQKRAKINKILQIHEKNLKKQEIQKQILNNNIFENQRLHLSKSASNIFDIRTENNDNMNKKERYYEVIYGNNRKHLEKVLNVKKINNHSISPGPNSYDIRGNLLNPKKGFTILGKRKDIIKAEECPEFAKIKSEFDIIAERKENKNIHYGERFKPMKKEENIIDPNYVKKWDNYKLNLLYSERAQNFRIFLEERKQRKKQQENLLKDLKEQERQIEQYNKEILIKKGYDDGEEYKPINYKLVEEQSPSYTLKGRNFVNGSYEAKNRNILSNSINYVANEISCSSNPLPNFNYPKPSMPAFSFDKAKRFNIEFNESDEEGNYRIFPDGKFAPDDRIDFSSKPSYSLLDPRGVHMVRNNYPGPGEYKIKSFTDKIIEEGKRINQNRERLNNSTQLNLDKKM